MNAADVATVPNNRRVQFGDYTIALSAVYQLLLLNPQRGCCNLSSWASRNGPGTQQTLGRRIRRAALAWVSLGTRAVLMSTSCYVVVGWHPQPAEPLPGNLPHHHHQATRTTLPTRPSKPAKPKKGPGGTSSPSSRAALSS